MRVQFGGPDKPVAALAHLLHSGIDRVPAGGAIHWSTYYFGNRQLARSLLEANRRGVKVAINIDAHPRRPEVNRAVMELLRDLDKTPGAGLRACRHVLPCHVHEKLFYFSHPRPVVYAGSYNPSRDETDRPELVEDIGDQDRGHNFLVEISDPGAVSFLVSHMKAMYRSSHSPLERFKTHLNAEYRSAELCIWLFPRRRSAPHFDALNDRSLKSVRVAASHFRDPTIARLLIKLAGRGTQVEVLCHNSFRRVPSKVERLLRQGGVGFWRYRHEDGVPMHNKFMLLESANEASVFFGSLNLTRTSRWLNHEVLMKSSNRELFSAFSMRWQQMYSELRIRGSAA